MEKRVVLLHTNDIHSKLDDMPQLGAFVANIRKENEQQNVPTIVVDCGDMLSGSIYFTLFQGAKEVVLANKIGYDFMTFGNHEFDKGMEVLAAYLEQSNAAWLSSNIDFTKDEHCGRFARSNKIKQTTTVTCENGLKIGIFALTSLDTLETGSPSAETSFTEPLKCAEKMVHQLREDVDILIVLSHLGFALDKQLAQKVAGIDLIIGGHSHTYLEKLHIENGVSIVQVGCDNKFVGQLSLSTKTGITYTTHCLAAYEQKDEEIERYVSALQMERDQHSSKVCGYSSERLVGEREALSENVTNLGTHLAQAYLNAGVQKGYQVDIGLINGGGIRTSIEAGPIRLYDLINVLPFGKQLQIFELTGQQLFSLLENGRWPQYAGIVQIEKNRNDRIESIVLENNRVIENTSVVIVAVNDYIAAGKDGYTDFLQANQIGENLGLDIDFVSEYFGNLSKKQVIRVP
ncbi:MAG: bifunctional metallophosphatase/5'-nucleotidase [Bacilli bacterium]